MSELVVSKTKLFISGVNWSMRGNDLKETFSKYGEIIFARVVLDKETKRSKGFGFVEFANEADAQTAKDEMDGQEVRGRAIKVDFAKEDPEKMIKRETEKSESSNEDETEIDETAF
ncbi:RNA-binding protein [bacterium]|nr:RNA-binding protein [bacterium]